MKQFCRGIAKTGNHAFARPGEGGDILSATHASVFIGMIFSTLEGIVRFFVEKAQSVRQACAFYPALVVFAVGIQGQSPKTTGNTPLNFQKGLKHIIGLCTIFEKHSFFMTHTISLPITDGPEVQSSRWMVVIFNDDHTPFDVVIFTLMIATNCSREEAELETWEAHHIGKASVHFASEEECLAVAEVIRRAGVKVEVCSEWKD